VVTHSPVVWSGERNTRVFQMDSFSGHANDARQRDQQVPFKGWGVRSDRKLCWDRWGTCLNVADVVVLCRGSCDGSKRPAVAGRGGGCQVVARRGTRRV